MPVFMVANPDGKGKVPRYAVHGASVNTWTMAPHGDPKGYTAVVALRREHAKLEPEMLAAQKACGPDQREWAKWFKSESKRCQRMVRACSLWISRDDQLSGPTSIGLWPVELAEECDLAHQAYDLAQQ